jgi:hypothetical protein
MCLEAVIGSMGVVSECKQDSRQVAENEHEGLGEMDWEVGAGDLKVDAKNSSKNVGGERNSLLISYQIMDDLEGGDI